MASLIAASASPHRDETRHLSPSKTSALLHDHSCLKQLRDQSPKHMSANGTGIVVQPVVSYNSHGAVITTGGPKTANAAHQTQAAADNTTSAAAAVDSSTASKQPRPNIYHRSAAQTPAAAAVTDSEAVAPNVEFAATAGSGKRAAAMRQLLSNDSFTQAQLAPKRQVLDHTSEENDAAQAMAWQQQQQQFGQEQQQQQDIDDDVVLGRDTGNLVADTPMQDSNDAAQQQQQQGHEQTLQDDNRVATENNNVTVLHMNGSFVSPFCTLPNATTATQAATKEGTQQQQQGGSSKLDTAAAGQMLPPPQSSRRPLLPRAEPSTAAPAGEEQDALAAAAAAESSLRREPSLSVGQMLACKASISSAASLEGWLPNSAVGEAIAAAVREQGSSPRAAAAAAAAAAAIMRSSSNASTATASMNRQGSLVFPLPPHPQQQQQHGGSSSSRLASATLESAGSFAGWPGCNSSAVQGLAGSSNSSLNREGSFSWPKVPARNSPEDPLKLDIQVLSPVIPEEYPDYDPSEQDIFTQQQQHILAQIQAAREAQQHGDRAFFAKIAAWEAELVGMLEQQAAPVSIRQIVAVFKDRINTERDKTEFKAICDKWTSVVEYPVGSGVKCLAIKSWMRS